MKKQILLLAFLLGYGYFAAGGLPQVGLSAAAADSDIAVEKQWIALFNGKTLEGWTPKFTGYRLGVNLNNIFRVDDGLLKVSYEDTDAFKGEFGHLFYQTPFSDYILRAEFRFTGEQIEGGPGWAFMNNGLMIHCQTPESLAKDQGFPTSIEVQLYGSQGERQRTMGNICTPQTHVVVDGTLVEPHVIGSNSKHYVMDQWVTMEVEVHGFGEIVHRVNGREVMRYEKPQLHDGTRLVGGHIAIQAETHPTEFRKIELLPLAGNRAVSHDGTSDSSRMNQAPSGYSALFDGHSLEGWKVHPQSQGHWTVTDGVIDYDALSEAPGPEKHLWTQESFGDFELHIDWRLKRTAGLYPMQTILPDGTVQRDAAGQVVTTPRPNADSGIFLRGTMKAQVNIWCWPVGSGEVWGYRTDPQMPAAVKKAVTPKVKADNPVGEWNTYIITMKQDRLTVVLNGETVISEARLPGVAARGPVGLQHHGGRDENGQMNAASSMIQFRNMFIKAL